MIFFDLISKKKLILYILIGVLHCFLTIYVHVPLSNIFPIPPLISRNIWTLIIAICIIIISLFKKTNSLKKYILSIFLAISITYFTSCLCAILILFLLF